MREIDRIIPSKKEDLPHVPLDENKKPAAVKSIYRAANILTCVSNGFNSITDIAEYCHLSKSTVHRLLKALGESNLIVQDPVSHEYYLGQLITRLISNPQITYEHLITCARKEMNHLSEVTRETICLSIMKSLKCTGLYEIPSQYQLRVVEAGPSIYSPLYAGAGGKTLLSLLENKELKIALKNIQIEPRKNGMIIDTDGLWDQVNIIRQRGYCITTDELVVGAMCIAAPIHNCGTPASLSIIGPTGRLEPSINDYVDLLLSSTARISKRLADSEVK